MKIKTQTSTYELTQAEDGSFILTKLTLKKGLTSLVPTGTVVTGREVRITSHGLYIMKATDTYYNGFEVKTSPVRL